MNREYVPHIAAYALPILREGYDRAASSFSRYRTFTRDLISKRAGGSYETDAEFYADDGSVYLHIEAKASAAQTATLARAIERHGALVELPATAVKEIEYVFDLAPRYLWIVGPGSLDPPMFLFEVQVDGLTNASFKPLGASRRRQAAKRVRKADEVVQDRYRRLIRAHVYDKCWQLDITWAKVEYQLESGDVVEESKEDGPYQARAIVGGLETPASCRRCCRRRTGGHSVRDDLRAGSGPLATGVLREEAVT